MAVTPPTDEQLNAYILARLALLGIDISVLPTATQTTLINGARGILRNTVTALTNYVADVQEHPPVLYTAPHTAWTAEDVDGKSLHDKRKEVGFA